MSTCIDWSDKYLSQFTDKEKEFFNDLRLTVSNMNASICEIKNMTGDRTFLLNQWNLGRCRVKLNALTMSLDRNVHGLFYKLNDRLDDQLKFELLDTTAILNIYVNALLSLSLLSHN